MLGSIMTPHWALILGVLYILWFVVFYYTLTMALMRFTLKQFPTRLHFFSTDYIIDFGYFSGTPKKYPKMEEKRVNGGKQIKLTVLYSTLENWVIIRFFTGTKIKN